MKRVEFLENALFKSWSSSLYDELWMYKSDTYYIHIENLKSE